MGYGWDWAAVLYRCGIWFSVWCGLVCYRRIYSGTGMFACICVWELYVYKTLQKLDNTQIFVYVCIFISSLGTGHKTQGSIYERLIFFLHPVNVWLSICGFYGCVYCAVWEYKGLGIIFVFIIHWDLEDAARMCGPNVGACSCVFDKSRLFVDFDSWYSQMADTGVFW